MKALPLLAAVLALVAVMVLAVVWQAPAVERDVVERVERALAAEGIEGVQVEADGREVVLSGAVADARTRDRAAEIAGGLGAVRTLSHDMVVQPPAEDPISRCQHEVRELLRREQIQFRSGSAEIESRSHPLLDRVVQVLRYCDDAAIQIGGHTDNEGAADANRRLSQARADAVRDYLRDAGIPEERMKAVGFGETHPIASNDSESGRRQNRRIEFILWRYEP